MDLDKIRIVKESFEKVVPVSDKVAEEFYKNLFKIDPEVRKLFGDNMKVQEQKLMATLMTVVLGLDNLEGILPSVEALGRRHIEYGVQPGHYTTVAAALLTTLEEILGDDFTVEVREAWTEVYWLLSKTMIDAAEGVEQE